MFAGTLVFGCGLGGSGSLSEADARVLTAAHSEAGLTALTELGETVAVGNARISIEDCRGGVFGSETGSGRIVQQQSFEVTTPAGPGLRTVQSKLSADGFVVKVRPQVDPTDSSQVVATRDEGSLILAFWAPSGGRVRVDVSAESPCVAGIG